MRIYCGRRVILLDSTFLLVLILASSAIFASGQTASKDAAPKTSTHAIHLPSPPISQQFVIKDKSPRCLYTLLRAKEHMTTTVYITESSDPNSMKAEVRISGPLAKLTPRKLAEHDAFYMTGPKSVVGGGAASDALLATVAAEDAKKRGKIVEPPQSGKEIYDAAAARKTGQNVVIREEFDAEAIMRGERPSSDYTGGHDDYVPMMDDYAYDHYDDWYKGGDDMVENTPPGRRLLAEESDRGHGKYKKRRRPDETGGAWVHTMTAAPGDAGWYEVCVSSVGGARIKAEIDLRKASSVALRENEELLDPRTGHVMTFEEASSISHERASHAKADDFKQTSKFLNLLQHKVTQIKTMQKAEQHRYDVHKFINERSERRMKTRGIVDLILFLVATAAQLISIRGWFSKSTPVLGGDRGTFNSNSNAYGGAGYGGGGGGGTGGYGGGGGASGYGYGAPAGPTPTYGQYGAGGGAATGGYSASTTPGGGGGGGYAAPGPSAQFQAYGQRPPSSSPPAGQQGYGSGTGPDSSTPGLTRRGNAGAGNTGGYGGGGYNY